MAYYPKVKNLTADMLIAVLGHFENTNLWDKDLSQETATGYTVFLSTGGQKRIKPTQFDSIGAAKVGEDYTTGQKDPSA